MSFPEYLDHEGGKVVSPTHRRLLHSPTPQGDINGTHFCYRLSRRQGHSAVGRIKTMKNPNDPATFQRVAQCLNQQFHRVLPSSKQYTPATPTCPISHTPSRHTVLASTAPLYSLTKPFRCYILYKLT